jgi:hypothetical protein
MRIDLTNPYNEGLNNLKNWRTRYSKTEYPFKVVQNIFYRQYTMNSIWDTQIENSFNKFKGTESDIIKAFQKLEGEYSNASQKFTVGNTLIELMNKKQDVGGLNYQNNISLIEKGKNGDNTAIEELEFTYLYYLLCNKSTLMWAAFGRKGFSRIDAIAQVTGVVIEYNQTITYEWVLDILGRIGCDEKMNSLYSALPKLF